jgi:serine/threonine protein kinase
VDVTQDGPTDAMPTQPRWAEIAAHRPLDDDDPREVGGYRLRARIGEGGMGKVYLSNTPGGRPIALKVIRFEQEVTTAQRVQGLYTAPVIDANPHSEHPWLATAYVAGPSLQQAVGVYGPLPPESVLILIAGIAEALQSIHAAGVVHRDLKPSNVILAADGPRVIDFGIARAVDTTSVTQAGMRVGTPAFMAPEQVRGQQATQALDIFALGTLACYAATGELPFGGGLDPAVPYRILEQEPDLTTCPPQIREIATLCLAKDPRQRPSPAQVIELCRQASTGTLLHMGDGWLPPAVAAAVSRIAVAPIPPAPKPPRKGTGRRTATVIGLVVVTAAAGIGVAAATGAFDSPKDQASQSGTSTPATSTVETKTSAAKNNSADSPSAIPTTSTTKTTSTATTTPNSTPVENGDSPAPLQRIEALDMALGKGIVLTEPDALVDCCNSYNMAHGGSAGRLYFLRADVVVLESNQTADYRTCVSDKRYISESSLESLPVGARICVLSDERVGLFEVKKTPDAGKPSKYYQFSVTIWNGSR